MDNFNTAPLDMQSTDEKSRKSLRKALTLIGVGTLTAFVFIYLFQIGTVWAINRFFPELPEFEWFFLAFNFVTTLVALLGIFTLFLKPIPTAFVTQKTDLKPFSLLKMFLALYPVAILLSAVSNVIMLFVSALFSKTISNPIEDVVANSNPWYTLLFIVILSPILEEVVFRGILLSKLRQYGNGIAIFTSGIIFGLFHGNLFQMFYAMFLGMFLAALVMKTGKLRHAIILHIIFNFCGSILPTFMLNEDSIILGAISSLLMVALFISSIITLVLTIVRKDFVITKKDIIKPTELKVFFTNPAIIAFIVIITLNTFASFAL